MLKDKEYLAEKSQFKDDSILLLNSDSVLERFKIIENYEKDKKLKDFFDVFSQTVFNAISGDLNKNNNQFPINRPEKTLKQTAKKILKIYGNLDYNVNLRTALEEIILQDLTDA
jgi:hypothetical protein